MKKTIFNSGILFLTIFVLLLSSSNAFAIKAVVGWAQYSGGAHPSTLNWTAYLTHESGTTITQSSSGSLYDSSDGLFLIQLDPHLSWSAGHVLHVDFNDGSGGTAATNVTLTNQAADSVNTSGNLITLVQTPKSVQFASVPSGLEITIDGTPHTTPYTLNTYQGTQHTIYAAAQSGGAGTQYVFSNWSIGGDSSRTYTVPSSPPTITATFTTQYKLTVSSAHGSVTGNGFHNAGSSVQFSVSPTTVAGGAGEQFIFTGWSGSGSGSYTGANATQSVTMDNAITETAQWQTQYQLTTSVSPPGSGNVTPDPTATGGWYNSGTSVDLTATNQPGYVFAQFTGSVSSTDNPLTVNMNSAKNITANFGQLVDVTINTSPAGRTYFVDDVSYNSEHTFNWVSGQIHKLEIVDDTQAGATGTRYVFSGWSQGGSDPQNYTVPGSNQSLTANFTTQHELTVNSTYGAPQGAGWKNAGTQATVSVTDPDVQGTTRYSLNSWSGDYAGTLASFNLTMNGPKTVTASWDTEYYLDIVSDHGSPTGEGWYASGANANFSVTSPDVNGGTRYVFQNWSGDHSGSATSDQITMNSAKTITANWLTQYYLTSTEAPDAGGDITPAPPGAWYDENDTANLNATVNSGYEWAGWTGDLSGTTKPTTLLMDAPKSVTANFNQVVDITINTSIADLEFTVDGTPYTTPQTFTWVVGSNHTLTTESVQAIGPTNYVFISWTDGGSRSHTYTVPSSNETVTANFEEKREATLTMQANVDTWGSVTPAKGDHIYDIGDSVPITATPQPGFKFKNWSHNVDNPQLQSTTVFINNDKVVTAYFGKQDFTLTMVADPPEGGEINPPPGDHTYNTYSLVELTATPNPGWEFVEWVGNVDDSLSASTTIRILDNETVTAKFQEISYTLDISVTPEGGGVTIPVAGSHDYASGEVVNLTATPNSGYRFVNWTGDVADVNGPTTTITMNANKAIVANFEPDQYTLTMAVSPVGGGVTTPAVGAHVLSADSVVELTATANEGYRFANWTGGVADPDTNITTVTLSSDKTITANFIRLGDVRVTTEPAGLRIVVDGQAYTAPQDFEWVSGSQHTIAIDSTTQSGGEGTQYLFSDWSDEGAVEHTITVNGVLVYTANFTTQHYLTTAVDPQAGGTITPVPPGGWYEENTKVELVAQADTAAGYRFTGWAGDLTGDATPDTVTMDAPKSVTANFAKLRTVVIATMPESLSVRVDGQKYDTPVEFMWEANSIHTISADTLKSGGVGKRHYFTSWSDGKAREHAVTVNGDTTFTANYLTQYYLSTAVEPEDGGQITPEAPGAWYASGTKVPVTATPNTDLGYLFVEWQGDLTGTMNPDTVTMDSAISVTALFSSGDFIAPRIAYAFPAKGAQNVPRNTPIQFKLKDEGSGINLATLQFSLEGTEILRNGADQTGGHAVVTFKNKTCMVHYTPAVALPNDSLMSMLIQCEDNSPAANFLDSTITFHVGRAQVTHTKTDTLTVEGGVVFDDSTGIAVSVPQNALQDTTEITISIVDDYPELPEGFGGFALGIHFGPAGLVFDDSVTISIPYNQEVLDSAGVSSAAELTIYYYSVLKGEWITLDIFAIDELNVYVKVKEFCYLVLGQKQMSLGTPAKPDGLVELVVDQYYSFITRSVISTEGDPVAYRFDWGDGFISAWSADTLAAHKWNSAGDYGIVVFARSTVDTTIMTHSDTLWVEVSIVNEIEEEAALPTVFKMDQNYPNPFNPETTIRFQLPHAEQVQIDIYNINGQHIRSLINEQRGAGYYSVIWNGANDSGLQVSTGLYFVQMRAGNYVRTVKMSFLK